MQELSLRIYFTFSTFVILVVSKFLADYVKENFHFDVKTIRSDQFSVLFVTDCTV